jgi:N-acetylneuraminate synthase
MTASFDFSELFVLDMANNHQGSVAHGKQIIDNCADLASKYDLKCGIKFQFRDLPEFVHPDEREGSENKHIPRFLGTMLSWEQFGEMADYAKSKGLLTICTPFDEVSAGKIREMGFDIIKIASCSAADWPLVEAAAATGLPMIASTGGLLMSQVDGLVSFLKHRAVDFALMHCVSIYPTPDSACNLSTISKFRQRYPGINIGWSTHEPPESLTHIGMAKALGATMYERHVGHATDKIQLNAYSSTKEQTEAWFEAYLAARQILGSDNRDNILPEETAALDGLRRSVFARRKIKSGEVLGAEDIYFAFPYKEGALASGEWQDGGKAAKAITENEALTPSNYKRKDDRFAKAETVIKSAIHEVKAMLNEANIPLSHDFQTEYSHHHGVERFRETGTVLITVVNREYAKKILVQLGGQYHPLHMHKRKEETFLVVHGDLSITIDGDKRRLAPGDQLTVFPGQWHDFTSDNGCIFEEISTTAHKDDSYYKDQDIDGLKSKQRKTVVDHWGRFVLSDQLVDLYAKQ